MIAVKSLPVKVLYALPLMVLLALHLIGFDGLYGQDSYEYLRYTDSFQQFILGGDHPGDLVWPKGYLISCALLGFILPNALAGQIISLFCLYGITYYLEKLIKLFNSNHRYLKVFILTTLLLSPYVLRLGVVMMADTLAILAVVATTYFAVQYKNQQTTKTAIAFLFWAAFAGFSRYAALVPIAPLLIWVGFLWLRKPRLKHLLGLIAPSLMLIIHFYLEAGGSDFLGHHFIAHWDFMNLFRSSFITEPELQIPNEVYQYPNLIYYVFALFHPGFFLGSVLILAFNLKRIKDYIKQFPLIVFLSILVYIIFLAGITYQGSRYLSLIYPLFLLFLYPAFADSMEKVQQHQNKVVLLLIVIQLALFSRAMYPTFQLNQFEQSLTKSLENYQGEVLYTFEVDVALQQRKLDFDFRSIWQKELKVFEPNALVLFNEERISKKFKGKNPMLNWEKMNQSMQLIEIEKLDSGWNLYRLEK